jgi:hypothetical protein
MLKNDDYIVSPPHYNSGSVECIDAISSFLGKEAFASYCLGQVIKYVWRAGKKDCYSTDLGKAQFYLSLAMGEDPRKST